MQFAEFLQHRSLKRLGILYQSTCVGLGYGLKAGVISWKQFRSPDNPISQNYLHHSSLPAGPGILTWFPSTTPFGLALGAGSPSGGLALPKEPLDLRRECLSHSLSLLMSAFSLPIPPAKPHGSPSQAYGTLRYHLSKTSPQLRCMALAPIHFRRRNGLTRPVSCYAFFKGWLLLSQPPGCLGLPTSFPT